MGDSDMTGDEFPKSKAGRVIELGKIMGGGLRQQPDAPRPVLPRGAGATIATIRGSQRANSLSRSPVILAIDCSSLSLRARSAADSFTPPHGLSWRSHV